MQRTEFGNEKKNSLRSQISAASSLSLYQYPPVHCPVNAWHSFRRFAQADTCGDIMFSAVHVVQAACDRQNRDSTSDDDTRLPAGDMDPVEHSKGSMMIRGIANVDNVCFRYSGLFAFLEAVAPCSISGVKNLQNLQPYTILHLLELAPSRVYSTSECCLATCPVKKDHTLQ